jgi:hypothetical protein
MSVGNDFDAESFMFGLGFGYELSRGEDELDLDAYDPETDDVLEMSTADREAYVEDLVEMTANMGAGISSASTEPEKIRFSDNLIDRKKPFESFVDRYIQDLNDGRR